MKIRARKIAALLAAVTLMSASGNPAISSAYASEGDPGMPMETVVAAEEPAPATEAPTEAPAPETQAPTEAPAPETQAPTEAPAPETQPPTEAPAPETQAPTEAPAPETQAPTEAPAPETQAPTEAPAQPETQAPATEAPTEAPAPETQTETAASTEAPATEQAATETPASESETTAQSETEKATESESEEEGKKRTFEAKATKGLLTIKLPKGKGVPESSQLVVDTAKYDESGNRGKVDKAVLGKQRVITGGRFYTISLTHDGEVTGIPEGTKISFSRPDGVDLSLKPYLQLKTHIYNVTSDSAEEIPAEISLDGNLEVTGFSFTAPKNLGTFALIGEENRANDGAAVSRGSVIGGIGEAANYAAVASSVSGEVQGDSISNSGDILSSLAGYSVSLANATSGGDAVVVNIFTDSNGNVQTDAGDSQDPMRRVLNGAGQIDVSGRMVVLNYVVTNPDTGHVSLPHYDVVSL